MKAIAEVFPPGEFLKDELEARGWNQTELADIMGRPVRLINEIIAGKRAVMPETAVQLAHAFGTSPELWLNMESRYQLSKVSEPVDLIARRARLYERYPVREMMRRRWIEPTKNIDALEGQFLAHFGIKAVDETPAFRHAAKKSNPLECASMLQLAWLFRARKLAEELVCVPYSQAALRAAVPRLAALLTAPEETRHVPRALAECGVRFVVVEPIPGTKIDGSCFWLSDNKPAIALSLRLDRIDNFWFVLRHEIEHVLQGHGKASGFVLDDDLDANDQVSEEEVVANNAAEDFCVPRDEMTGFLARVAPFFSEERVVGFARRLGVHPGIVVGQLQRRLRRWDLLRRHQAKIRQFLTASARTDGWGVLEA